MNGSGSIEKNGRQSFQFWIKNLFFGLRLKLIMPYVILTLVVSGIGIFIVTQLVTSSMRERFVNQLFEASRVAADGIVNREEIHLENLRLMAFTEGVPNALLKGNRTDLENLLFPLVLNENVQLLTLIDRTGIEILSIIQDPLTGDYVTSIGADLSELELVRLPLFGYNDEVGDKFSVFEQTQYGPYLMTSAPVHNSRSQLVGVIVIGSNIDSLVKKLKSQALADTILMNTSGKVLDSTFSFIEESSNNLALNPNEIEALSVSLSREVTISDRKYEVFYSQLILRQKNVGFLGVALPTNFIVTTESTSQITLSIIFTLATLGIVVIGYLLAVTISRPILRLRDAAVAVGSGDLNQRANLHRRDEIGQLGIEFDRMVANLQDRTSELAQSEKLSAIGQLAAGIAHDVKNPLGVIKGLAEEIEEDMPKNSDTVKYLKVIQDNASRADSILNDLMTFSRQSAFEMKYQNICDTVHKAVRLTSYLVRKAYVELEIEIKSDPILTYFASQQIEQVLINLIQNAVQAMPDKGKIHIKVSEFHGDISISIADTGQGIEQENLNKIFDPFYTTKPEGQGTGLGLSVSYGIIKKHQGIIKVESAVGVGTTFVINLPQIDSLPEETN